MCIYHMKMDFLVQGQPYSEVSPTEGCWYSEEDSVRLLYSFLSEFPPFLGCRAQSLLLEFYPQCRVWGLKTAFSGSICNNVEEVT